ncbi:MAG: glycosyltransferase, partial [Lachnospiraceae bacterium]|nr:glycosyltransferase [Lachnospiraceae bacterium]
MEKDPKVSVIVPVKNGGAYIRHTMEGILDQTYGNLELIVVDNGSTDATREQILQVKDERIIFLSEEKPGVSAARNKGLSAVSGDYIVFSDADDEVSNSYIADLLALMKEDVALGVCGYETRVVHEDGRDEKIKESPEEEEPVKFMEEMLKRLFATKYYEGFIWNKMFRADVIKNVGLRFDEDICFNEDRLFILSYLLEAKGNTVFTAAKDYRYMIRRDSAMNAFREGDAVSEAEITEFAAFEKMRRRIRDTHLPEVLFALEEDMIQSELRCFKRMVSKEKIFRYRKSRMRNYARQAG